MYKILLQMEAKKSVSVYYACENVQTNPQSLCQHYHVKATLESIKIGLFNVPQT